MLQNLIIPAQKGKPYFPTVEFKTNGNLVISGASYMENAFEFYDVLLDWLDELMELKQDIHLDISMEYLNTSSSKCINNLFLILDDYHIDGFNANVNWYFKEGDIDSHSEGIEFKEEVEFPFKLISVPGQNVSSLVA